MSDMYCPFPNELCNCREGGTTKIGHYTLDGWYVPRKLVAPTTKDYEKRRKAAEKE